MRKKYVSIALLLLVGLLSGCAKQTPTPKKQTLKVTATAYTSSKRETDSTPFLAAWKNKLKPGIKSIAVSRDLLALGLTNGAEVSIDGLEGKYKVLDKMNKRWEKKIDIYMGLNRKKAINWGKQTVTIRWEDKPLKTPKREKESLSLVKLPKEVKTKDTQTL